MTEFFGHVFSQHKSIVAGAIKNVTFRRMTTHPKNNFCNE